MKKAELFWLQSHEIPHSNQVKPIKIPWNASKTDIETNYNLNKNHILDLLIRGPQKNKYSL